MDTQRTPSERTAEKARPLGKADRAAAKRGREALRARGARGRPRAL